MKTCKQWQPAIAAYKKMKGVCEACLYQFDDICPYALTNELTEIKSDETEGNHQYLIH